MIKGSFPISKVLVFGGKRYVWWKMKILDYFMIANGKDCDERLFSYVCGKNEDIRLFYDCTW